MKDQNDQSVDHMSDLDDIEHSKSTHYTWIWVALVGIVLVVAVLAVVILLRENGSTTDASGADPLNFAEVVITDLIQEESFNGTLGFIEDDPVTTQLGGTITQIAEKGDSVSQGEALFAINDQPAVLLYGDLPAYRDIAIGDGIHTISSPPNGTITWVVQPGTVIQQGDELYRVDDQPVIVLYGDQPAYRDVAIVTSGGTIDETVTILNQIDGTITWAAEPDTTIQQGDVLFRVDDIPVIALYGDQPAYRTL